MAKKRTGAYVGWVFGSLGLIAGGLLIGWGFYAGDGFTLSGTPFWYTVSGFALFVLGAFGAIAGAIEDRP